jgi:hypothetical protein
MASIEIETGPFLATHAAICSSSDSMITWLATWMSAIVPELEAHEPLVPDEEVYG